MLTVSDLLHLPYTRDLTEGGIACALHSLPYLYNRTGNSPYDHLRRVVAGTMVELAFRRYLTEQAIPFEVKGAAPFAEPDRYDVWLAGHRCGIKSFLITHREQVEAVRHNPQILLGAPALVASDQHAAAGHAGHELYLFAFLTGWITTSQSELQKVIETNQPQYLVHAMPEAWRRPSTWHPLGPLAIKSEAEEKVTIEIGGQAEGRERRTCTVELPPRTRVEAETGLFSVSHVHVAAQPRARIGIHLPIHNETHLIGVPDWGNIWVYGMDVLLAGYMAREEFSRCARFLQAGARVFQYDQTHVKNLAVPVSDLKPLRELFERVKAWSSQTTT